MASRRLTNLEKRYYSQHPRPNVEPSDQLLLKARGRRKASKSKKGDRFIGKLNLYSQAKLDPSDSMMKVFMGLGWVGVTGKITAKGRKSLNSYARRKGAAGARRVMYTKGRA